MREGRGVRKVSDNTKKKQRNELERELPLTNKTKHKRDKRDDGSTFLVVA